MMRVILFVVVVLVSTAAHTQDVTRLYSTVALQRSAEIYSPNLRGMWAEDFLSRLTRAERKQAGAVTLYLPLAGANRHPLDFYSDPARRSVFIPIASTRFIDDMAIAFAYYDRKACDLGLVSDYAAVLRFRPDAVGGSPLETLGVPSNALSDAYVDDVSQKILKSTIYFVAAHEYAHVMYRHRAYTAITAQQAQTQEIEADAFALDVMRRIGVAPMAMTYFFLIATRLEPSPVEFPSPEAYEGYLKQRATHPISSSRISKVADGIDANLESFARLQADPATARRALRLIVPQLREIADTLESRDMRNVLAERARGLNVSALRTACDRR